MTDLVHKVAIIVLTITTLFFLVSAIYLLFVKRNGLLFAVYSCFQLIAALSANVLGGLYVAGKLILAQGQVDVQYGSGEITDRFLIFFVVIVILTVIALALYTRDRWYEKGYIP